MPFVLSWEPVDEDDPASHRVETEFDTQDEAQQRACEVLWANEGHNFQIKNEAGEVVADDRAITSHCAALKSGGSGDSIDDGADVVTSGHRAPRRIDVIAAVFNQGGQFAVVQAQDSVLMFQNRAEELLSAMTLCFQMPVLLMGQQRRFGHPNLVRAFQNVHISQITGWRRYTFTL